MRAVVIDGFGTLPELREVPNPPCPADGAVIRVAATGLCRSDWHGWVGHAPEIVLPHVPGHEFTGTVIEVGRQVERWSVGARVTMPFIGACGSCEQCRSGEQQVCARQSQPGFDTWGSFAELVAVAPADVNLVAIPAQLDSGTAAALGCRIATAYRAVTAHARPEPGQWLAIHGCGGVGLSAIAIASSREVRTVAIDVSPAALEQATRHGASATILVQPGVDVAAAVLDITDGGAHASIDALGSAETCRNSVECLRPRGRHVQVGLLPPDRSAGAVPMARVIGRELEIYGSHGMAAPDYPPLLDDVLSGRLRIDTLVTRRIGLAEAPAALVALNASFETGVTIIEP